MIMRLIFFLLFYCFSAYIDADHIQDIMKLPKEIKTSKAVILPLVDINNKNDCMMHKYLLPSKIDIEYKKDKYSNYRQNYSQSNIDYSKLFLDYQYSPLGLSKLHIMGKVKYILLRDWISLVDFWTN